MARQNQIRKPALDIDQPKRRKLTPSKVSRIFITLFIVAALVFILFLPRTEFFKGSLIPGAPGAEIEEEEQPEADVQAGSIVVKYEHDQLEVKKGDKDVTVSDFGINIGYEPIEISALTYEVAGAESSDFKIQNLFINDNIHENVNFEWLNNTTLLVDLTVNPVELEPSTEDTKVYLTADIENGESGDNAEFHVTDVTAKGLHTDITITNIGINGDAVPKPNLLLFI